MRQIPLKPLSLAVLITFILFVIAIIVTLQLYFSYRDVVTEYKAVQAHTKEYDILKKRWSIDGSKNDIEYFKSHPNVTKQEKQRGKYRFEFENLSSSEFDRLSNSILNSMLMIKKLTLRKEGESKGVIHVEFEL